MVETGIGQTIRVGDIKRFKRLKRFGGMIQTIYLSSMGFCEQCKKWISQPEGKKKKRFCNSTCRSNFWYGQNKKGKIEFKETTPAAFDGAKLPDNFTNDVPLSFDVMKQKISAQKGYNEYLAELEEAEDLGWLENVGRAIQRSGLNWKEKQFLHAEGKRIAQRKFTD